MAKLLLILVFTFSINLFADNQIDLPAGGKATVNAGDKITVTCEASTTSPYKCVCISNPTDDYVYLHRVEQYLGKTSDLTIGYYCVTLMHPSQCGTSTALKFNTKAEASLACLDDIKTRTECQ